jgi:hypothetical protein
MYVHTESPLYSTSVYYYISMTRWFRYSLLFSYYLYYVLTNQSVSTCCQVYEYLSILNPTKVNKEVHAQVRLMS